MPARSSEPPVPAAPSAGRAPAVPFIVRVAVRSLLLVAMPAALLAQESVDSAAVERFKAEGFQRSEVMELASWLTDVHGPRLTNSPQARAAGLWAVQTLQSWGLENVHLEWFPFGRGWQNDRTVAHVLSPVPHPVLAFPGAWTVGTENAVTAEVVAVPFTNQSTEADFERYRGTLRGRIVLLGTLPDVQPLMRPPGSRLTEEELDRLASAAIVPAAGGRPGGPPAGVGRPQPTGPDAPASADYRRQFWVSEGVVAVLTAGTSRGNSGSVSNAPTGNRQPDAPASVPQVAVSAEHFGRMYRQLEKEIPVHMELDVRNRFTDDTLAFNVIAEIPGTDKADELVMLGAHFDSWHNATGATDNGGSSAVMMEAMRILKASGLPMRRTVRMALWTGEEQGLIGSRIHVQRHFGTPDEPGPAHQKISAYFNQDNGGGAIRGIYTQGNESVAPIFAEWMKVLDSDSITVRHVTLTSTSGTDHLSFDRAGIPGFQFIQDPIEYYTRTHHSSQDFYERLQPADMRHNAVVLATFVYLAANREEPLPRKGEQVSVTPE